MFKKTKPFILIYNHDWDKLSELSANAIVCYIHLKRRFNGGNNGNISYSCREMADSMGKSKSTVKNAFDELIKNNFIEITRESNFDYKVKYARYWKLTGLKNKKKHGTKK